MFNIVWSVLVSVFVPSWLRLTVRLAWLNLLVSQTKALHNDFLTFRNDILYKLAHNGQIIYLTKALNDKFDPINRGIYIDNVIDVNRIYLRRQVENKPFYLYRRWSATLTYASGEFAVAGGFVWKCTVGHTNQPPGLFSPFWVVYKKLDYLKRTSEYALLNDFLVYVPSTLVFDTNEMKATVNFYKAASKRYTILTY